MIACYYGYRAGLAELRYRFQPSAQGATLAQLIDIGAQLHLSGRALRTGLDALPQLQTPCILHWDMNHFVVLKSATPRTATIHDPARGILALTPAQISRHYTGVALELTPTDTFRPRAPEPRLRLRDLWTRVVGLKRNLAIVLALSLLLQLFAIASPFYMQTVVDDVVLRRDTGLLKTLATGFSLLMLIEVGSQALRASVILQLSTRLHFQLASNLVSHLLRLPLVYFQRRQLGDVLSRFASLESVRDTLSSTVVTAVVDGLMALAMLVVMLLYDWMLSLVVMAGLFTYSAARFALLPMTKRLSQDSIVLHAEGETSLIESVRAIQTIKLHQAEARRQGHWLNRLASAMNADIRLARLGIGLQAGRTLLFGIENILVVYLAAQAVIANALSIGMVFAFMSYKQRFNTAIDSLVDRTVELKMLALHLHRISDIALAEKEPQQLAAPTARPSDSRLISLTGRHLGFRYCATDPWVFRDISLGVTAGSSLAITGASGAGKTTLMKCLMGLLTLSEGDLVVNGLPPGQYRGYRACIGSVMQNDCLLSGSIAENIACFDNRYSRRRIEHCAELACVHDEIRVMPMQYETQVGDMGSTLSGGQVQRILLARALYRRPRVLFLDEATSHVDATTEQEINHRIAALRITRIMVAHRPQTIETAEHVIDLRRACRKTTSRNDA